MTGNRILFAVTTAIAVGLFALLGGATPGRAQSAPTEVIAFGNELAALAADGDVEAIVALAVTDSFTCPVDEAYPAQACVGKPDGTVVQAYRAGILNTEPIIADEAGLEAFLRSAIADRFAATDFQLYAVAQGNWASEACTACWILVVSTAEDTAGDPASVLTFEVTEDSGASHITRLNTGLAGGANDPASIAMVRGGIWGQWQFVRVGGLATPVPPSTGSGIVTARSERTAGSVWLVLELAGAGLALGAGAYALTRQRRART